jgi:hypothetical protein
LLDLELDEAFQQLLAAADEPLGDDGLNWIE